MKSGKSSARVRSDGKEKVDVKEAVKVAKDYFANLFHDSQYSDLLLEEVELSEDEKHWLITLSYAYEPPMSQLSKALEEASGASLFVTPKQRPRKYKLFKIDAATGKVEAMKIRSI